MEFLTEFIKLLVLIPFYIFMVIISIITILGLVWLLFLIGLFVWIQPELLFLILPIGVTVLVIGFGLHILRWVFGGN